MQGAQALLTVVGSGTLVPDGARGSPAHHLALPSASVLFDSGPGALHGMARHGVAWATLSHVVLSHFHQDHIGDLAALLVALRYGPPAPRSSPRTLIGPPGLGRVLGKLCTGMAGLVTTAWLQVRGDAPRA